MKSISNWSSVQRAETNIITNTSLRMEVAFSSKNFLTDLNQCFQELFKSRELTDVTLVFDDQMQLDAHKIILSAWSPVFRSMFANNSHPHPIIFLKGMSYRTVLSILEFLYKGEVTIAKDSVDEFLSDAEDLQISQFLLDSTSVRNSGEGDVKAEERTDCGRLGDNQLKLFKQSGDLIEESVVELLETPGNFIETERSPGQDQGQGQHGNKKTGEKIFKSGSRYSCQDCGTAYSTRNGLWYHRRSKHQTLSLPGNVLPR